MRAGGEGDNALVGIIGPFDRFRLSRCINTKSTPPLPECPALLLQVVFDEAHNIDNVCIEALSVNIRQQTLDAAGRNLTRLRNVSVLGCVATSERRLSGEPDAAENVRVLGGGRGQCWWTRGWVIWCGLGM